MANPFMRVADEKVADAIQQVMRIRGAGDILLASARKVTQTQMVRGATAGDAAEAWDMRELVGELRFLTNTIAVKGSQARFYVGKIPANQEDAPRPVKSGPAFELWQEFCRYTDLSELIKRALNNYQISGEGYLAGVPGLLLDRQYETMEWYFLSKDEVMISGDDVTLKVCGQRIETKRSDVELIQTWNPHPKDSTIPDSPTLSALPILREIVGLTMHVSAQIDSRLCGAGVLAVPQSATLAVESENDSEDDVDPFTSALIEAAVTAYNDRSSAAAKVPIIITVPDEAVKNFEFLKFWTDLDTEARPLREEAIRRLALAMDAPPELLLGQSDMNHWGAWVSREETVQNNVSPLLTILARAITQEILWSGLVDVMGLDEDEARRYVICYDTTHMISRSNRTQDALSLHARGVISDEALRNTADFDEKDAPPELFTDPALKIVMDLVKASPSLAETPGIPILVAQISDIIDGGDGTDLGRALTPPEENANPEGPSETPAEGLPPGEGGTRESTTND